MTLVRDIRRRLKATWHAARLAYVRRYRSYAPAALRQALVDVGLRPGDAVLMHCRLSPFSGFLGQPAEILSQVKDTIGAEGTLLMMSMPYRTSTRKYLQTSPTFDVRRTPSRMGLVSEIFRRTAGVSRSLSPTHPVLASGPRAQWFLQAHEQTPFPCGDDTPFSRLVEANAKILFFDLPLRGFTFMHYVEHSLREDLPFDLYDAETFTVPVVTQGGEVMPVRVRPFSQEAASRRRIGVPARRMLKHRCTSGRRIGNTQIFLIAARDALRLGRELYAKGDLFRS